MKFAVICYDIIERYRELRKMEMVVGDGEEDREGDEDSKWMEIDR